MLLTWGSLAQQGRQVRRRVGCSRPTKNRCADSWQGCCLRRCPRRCTDPTQATG